MTYIYLILSCLIPLYFLFVPKGQLAIKIYKRCYKKEKLGLIELIYCYTPFWNTYIIKKALYGKAKLYGILSPLILVLSVMLIAFKFVPTGNSQLIAQLQIIDMLIMWGFIVIIYIMEVILCWDLSTVFNYTIARVFILIPFICEMMIVSRVDNSFKKHSEKIKGTFEGDDY